MWTDLTSARAREADDSGSNRTGIFRLDPSMATSSGVTRTPGTSAHESTLSRRHERAAKTDGGGETEDPWVGAGRTSTHPRCRTLEARGIPPMAQLSTVEATSTHASSGSVGSPGLRESRNTASPFSSQRFSSPVEGRSSP